MHPFIAQEILSVGAGLHRSLEQRGVLDPCEATRDAAKLEFQPGEAAQASIRLLRDCSFLPEVLKRLTCGKEHARACGPQQATCFICPCAQSQCGDKFPTTFAKRKMLHRTAEQADGFVGPIMF